MKKIIISAFSLLTMLFTTGCSDWLDVNHDPNVLEKIPSGKILLPAAELNIGNSLMGWDLGFAGAFWSEYWTQKYTGSQFKSLCEYDETSFNYAYMNFTSGALTDLKKIKELSASEADKGYYFIAEALSIFTWQLITDIWGDIPYTEALRGNEGIVSPQFDKGEDIYADLINRIDALLNTDISNAKIDGNFDFIYAGDMNKWKAFANTLKLKLMLRLSETSSYNNANVLTFIENNEMLTTTAKVSGKTWVDGQEGKRHPMREFEVSGANYFTTNIIGCKNFVEYLSNNDDPRIDKLFSITDSKVGYRGAFFGDFDSKEKSDGSTRDDQVKYCVARIDADLDLVYMSDWETWFYMAEVYARANQFNEAKTAYENGVKASLAQHGIAATDIIENGYAQWQDPTNAEEAIKQIGMQKWVANANYQHIESFLERNRIKYPAIYNTDIKSDRTKAYSDLKIPGNLTVAVNGRAKLNNTLPSSPIYPDEIMARNENSPAQKPNLGVKVWWNKKAEVIIK